VQVKPLLFVALLAWAAACQSQTRLASELSASNEKDLSSCLRTIMELDEGRWAYMGTIARVNGTFRTYEAISLHTSEGDSTWSAKAFGGDVGGDEGSAETNIVKLIGNSRVPLEDGEPNHDLATRYTSCAGPDAEGRYETTSEYKIPVGDGTFDYSKNMTWYSEHGSYYAEDHYDGSGRIIARRSGVNTPLEE